MKYHWLFNAKHLAARFAEELPNGCLVYALVCCQTEPGRNRLSFTARLTTELGEEVAFQTGGGYQFWDECFEKAEKTIDVLKALAFGKTEGFDDGGFPWFITDEGNAYARTEDAARAAMVISGESEVAVYPYTARFVFLRPAEGGEERVGGDSGYSRCREGDPGAEKWIEMDWEEEEDSDEDG